MRWSPEKQARVLGTLDTVERSVVSFWKILLWLLLIGLVAVVVVVFARKQPGGNTQGEYYYFAVAALLIGGWIVAQLAKLRVREDRGRDTRPDRWPDMRVRTDTSAGPLDDGTGYQRSWRLQVGADPDTDAPPESNKSFTFSHGLEIPLASLPSDVLPDDDTLGAIAAGLAAGASLDELCAVTQPAYRNWGAMAQGAYRVLIEMKLAERKLR